MWEFVDKSQWLYNSHWKFCRSFIYIHEQVTRSAAPTSILRRAQNFFIFQRYLTQFGNVPSTARKRETVGSHWTRGIKTGNTLHHLENDHCQKNCCMQATSSSSNLFISHTWSSYIKFRTLCDIYCIIALICRLHVCFVCSLLNKMSVDPSSSLIINLMWWM